MAMSRTTVRGHCVGLSGLNYGARLTEIKYPLSSRQARAAHTLARAEYYPVIRPRTMEHVLAGRVFCTKHRYATEPNTAARAA